MQFGLEYAHPGLDVESAVFHMNRITFFSQRNQVDAFSYLALITPTIETMRKILGFTEMLWLYNNERPNMALCGITPKQKLPQAAEPLLLYAVINGGITPAWEISKMNRKQLEANAREAATGASRLKKIFVIPVRC